VGVAPAAKQKALCVATRCTTAQQFIETFHRFCDEQSFFVATLNMRGVGLETPFSIQLADKTPVLRGLCVVLAAYTTAANPYKRPGIRLGIRRLTPESEAVFYQLQAMRTATPQEIANEASEATEVPIPAAAVPIKLPPIPTAPRVSPPAVPKKLTPPADSVIGVPPKATPSEAVTVVEPSMKVVVVEPTPVVVAPPAPVAEPPAPVVEPPAPVVAVEQRTPGSDFVLPANPLSNLSDDAIVGFVDCTLYEETANFFRADAAGDFEPEDPIAAPPPPQPPLDALPAFSPGAVIAHAFPAEVDLSGPTNVRHTGAMPPLELPLPAPVHVETESSMKAAITRVEHSVAMILDTLDKGDTSRPIDEASRPTPMAAGEAYARQVAKTRAKSRSKWILVAGAGAVATIAIAILVVATRSSADETPKPVEKPDVVASKASKPVDPVDTSVTDVPKVDVDGDELAAVAEKNPGTPVVGDGPCRLEVNTTPAGTMVKVDGDTIGPSPITLAGPCARRRIDLVHPRYKAEQRWVALTADKPGSLDVTLSRPTHTLLVTSNPTGATVFIAGRRAGTTPTRVPLMGFSGIEVKLQKKGFDPVSKRIYSKVSNDKLSVTLKRSLFIK
jgi:hypothetical protein